MIRALLAAITLLGLAACSPAPKLIRHYERLDAPDARSDALKLSGFSVSPSQNPSSTLVSRLSERGQAELIRVLAGRLAADAKPADLIALLSEPHESKQRACSWASRTTFSRRVAITLHGDLQRPADRIDKLTVSLGLPEDSIASYVSWDRFDSAYASFNVGTATFKQTRKLTLNRDDTETRNLPQAAGSNVTLFKLGGELGNEYNESAAYSIRRLSLGGALSEHRAELIQEGGPNINLFGTVIATINLRVRSQQQLLYVFRLTLRKDNKNLAPPEVSIDRCAAEYPEASSPIVATLTGTALVRKVGTNDSTVTESDDAIRFDRLAIDETAVELLDQNTLDAKLFALVKCDPGQAASECKAVEIETTSADGTEELVFESFAAATAFRAWLLESTKTGKVEQIAGYRVGLGYQNLTGLSQADIRASRVAVRPFQPVAVQPREDDAKVPVDTGTKGATASSQ